MYKVKAHSEAAVQKEKLQTDSIILSISRLYIRT